MLRVMLNKDDTKSKAVQSVMQDRSLSALERNKKIQDVMAGKVVLLRDVAAEEPASLAISLPIPWGKEKRREPRKRGI